ncbi:universal stress protein [Streptomyces sp. NPDC056796]|uniref:universal stress protein n=1 Tax=Streptomyces sp. NPDC056796 TaxID=3345947 RepID=UPI0036BA7FA8
MRDEHDARWLVRAGQEAQAWDSPLRLVSVRNLLARFGARQLPHDEAGRDADPGERPVEALASRIREGRPGLTVRTEVVEARSTASALVEASRHAQLLVMGSHERRGVSVLGLGHVVHALLHHSHCPVHIVPYLRDAGGVAGEGLAEGED